MNPNADFKGLFGTGSIVVVEKLGLESGAGVLGVVSDDPGRDHPQDLRYCVEYLDATNCWDHRHLPESWLRKATDAEARKLDPFLNWWIIENEPNADLEPFIYWAELKKFPVNGVTSLTSLKERAREYG